MKCSSWTAEGQIRQTAQSALLLCFVVLLYSTMDVHLRHPPPASLNTQTENKHTEHSLGIVNVEHNQKQRLNTQSNNRKTSTDFEVNKP